MPRFRLDGAHRRLLIVSALGAVLLMPPSPAADDAADTGAMRVYRDPATGEFTEPPATEPSVTRRTEELGSGASDLVEEPGATDAGGVTIDLQGRFRSSQSVTEDGRSHCVTDPPR